MGLGKQSPRKIPLAVPYDKIPRSQGHPFYDRLQSILNKNDFDRFAEKLCEPFYVQGKGRPSIPPGRYFRMHIIGYFEGIDSERGLEWRCSDSLSLRNFLKLEVTESVPDHSSLSRIRSRFSLEVHDKVFIWVLKKIEKAGLVSGRCIGIDSSTMEANAAMKTIKRRDTGENYRQMLERMAKESGIETPKYEDLIRMDKKRKGKKLSNEDWESPTDPDSKVGKMKDGRTRMGYKPEHTVDLDSGAVLAAEVHPLDKGDTKTLNKTLETTIKNLKKTTDTPPCADDPAELSADKGYHSRKILKDLDDSPWKTRIAEPKPKGLYDWKGDHEARRAVYNNRKRTSSKIGKHVSRLRMEIVERSFQHILDRGGMRRVWLRSRENVQKRYLIHVAGYNLGLLMRKLMGYGTPKGAAQGLGIAISINIGLISVFIFIFQSSDGDFFILAAFVG